MKPRWVYSDTEQDKWLDGPFVIISNIDYYMNNETKIKQWLTDNDPDHEIQGVVIRLTSRNIMLMFEFRWDEKYE